MTFNSNEDQNNNSAWNPFFPTKRDIERTEVLASKSPVAAGVLTFLFLPAAMIYLNRGVNNLKLFGYMILFIVMLTIAGGNNSEKESENIGSVVGVFVNITLITENARAVTLARKRKSEANF
ncbi:MAG: hypothetical protein WBA39_13470 [Rivularia sp. (in: cyanobacteria)]